MSVDTVVGRSGCGEVETFCAWPRRFGAYHPSQPGCSLHIVEEEPWLSQGVKHSSDHFGVSGPSSDQVLWHELPKVRPDACLHQLQRVEDIHRSAP